MASGDILAFNGKLMKYQNNEMTHYCNNEYLTELCLEF